MSEFAGFPVAALDFYDDLEMDNTRSFWEAHKAIYDEAVKAPMAALVKALEPEFGTAKVFRPYRDVRFAKDKTPYKTHQGAFVATGPSTGWYVEIAARGMRVGAGFYEAGGEQLTAVREAIDDDTTGRRLQRALRKAEKAGFELGGEKLKTSPRGYDATHPRIELLRHKQILLARSYGFETFIHGPELLDRVRSDWRAMSPLLTWLEATTGR
jgi:uncharacterized protein (TIGR02453 family)